MTGKSAIGWGTILCGVAAVLALLIVVIFCAGPLALAQGGYALSWWTVDGGGGFLSDPGNGYTLMGTISQPDAKVWSGGGYTLIGGFWGAMAMVDHTVYLPVTLRNYVPIFEGPWEQEDNDTYLQANGSLVSGRDYSGYPDDEKDYFSFYARNGGPIVVDLTGHTGSGVQLQLFYGSVGSRVGYDVSPPYHIEYTGAPGWYYVYIYTASGYNSSTLYTLRATYP
jgi:hypothetical protein